MIDKKLFTKVLLLTAYGFLMTSCLENDQTVIKPEHLEIGNPVPTPRNFAQINAGHKILIAVFDSGIDYNHPDLINNVHFDLNQSGQPIGCGKDYLADDNWASYRWVETNSYEFKFLSKEEKADQLNQTTEEQYNTDLHRRIDEKMCLVESMLELEPRLGKYIHPYRATAIEHDVKHRHGTHVAGLAVYDRPDFGVIPYRVLPYHENKQDKIDSKVGKADKFADNFADAVADADKKGVRIVNLSLGGAFQRPDKIVSSEGAANMQKFNNALKIISGKLTETIRKYPHILFVAAAGNDGSWSDNESRLQYPCGLEADNILCVGALNDRGRATFTNIPFSDIDVVFAPGLQIKSLSPADHCPFLDPLIEHFLKKESGAALCDFDANTESWTMNKDVARAKLPFLKSAYDVCTFKGNMYATWSGTSMATPLVAHMAAEIQVEKNFKLAKDLLAEIKRRATIKKTKSSTAHFLTKDMFKTPSWFDPEPPVPSIMRLTKASAAQQPSGPESPFGIFFSSLPKSSAAEEDYKAQSDLYRLLNLKPPPRNYRGPRGLELIIGHESVPEVNY